MKGEVRDIVRIFDGNDTELVIPVYQRNYDWSEEQCARLFDDLVDVITHDRPKHFFGAVVGNPETKFRWVVIDGQQRITTVSLLILALADALDEGEIESTDAELADRLRRNYLENAGSTVAEPKLKLKPVKDDLDSYRRLLTGQELNERSNATANYCYFRERIRDADFDGDKLWTAIGRLETMILDLENHDDPQRIFESLNSTGKSLTESDKIRNLVLMGLTVKEQENLYENYWNRIEHNVAYDTDAFIRLYLVTRTRKTPRLDHVYEAFKRFLDSTDDSIETVLHSMRDYSEYYRDLNTAKTGITQADRRLRRFNIMRREVAMPTLMPLLGDHRAGDLQAEDVAATIELIDSYIFRRLVVDIPTHGLNKIFATLYSEARRIRHHDALIADVIAYLLYRRAGTSGEFPDDNTFREAFGTRNFFAFRPHNRRYLFECLENRDSKDVVDVAGALERGELSVEHVMPQTLTKAWREELGPDAEEIHHEWLHRIGNLTVTGYNSEYSNSSFQTKKSIPEGFDSSPYRLNDSIKKADTWGEEQIERRSKRLSDIAVAYWAKPKTGFEPVREPLPEVPMGDDTDFTSRSIIAYEFNDVSVTVKSFKDMMRSLLKTLIAQHRESIFEYAEAGAFGFSAGPKPTNRYQEEIVSQLWVQTRNSTAEKMTILRGLFQHLGIDTDDLVFTLRPLTDDEEPEDNGRYADILKFLPQAESFINTDAVADDIADLRSGLRDAIQPYLTSQAQPRDIQTLREEATQNSFTPEEVFNAFQSLVEIDKYLPGKFVGAVTDGTIAALIRQLQGAEATGASGG